MVSKILYDITRDEAELKLNKVFGIAHFYDDQWNCIEKILSGKRVLMIQKTGFGKSLCYQFPAVLLDGVTIIFSPLIALMKDQVANLNKLGICANYINSEQDEDEQLSILLKAIKGDIKILYIAPERLDNELWNKVVDDIKISMVIIDEAHCISVWGHDFRPSYRRIIELVRKLPKHFPVLATTATATKRAESDITKQMGDDVEVIRGDLLRRNLYLDIVNVKSEEEKMIWLGENLNKLDGSGIIYVGTKANAEIYANWLNYLSIPATFYHGGLNDPELKNKIFEGFLNNKWKCIVATNALGMGIDKSDIRFIIHTQIPQSPIHYYQEIGRAGRDGANSYISLLFDKNHDLELPLNFIKNAKPPIEDYYLVLSVIKSGLYGMKEILIQTNIKQPSFETIVQDFIDQNIVTKNVNRKYEYIGYTKKFDSSFYEEIRKQKLDELDLMVKYTEQKEGERMKFLCGYLGDTSSKYDLNNFDYSNIELDLKDLNSWLNKIDDFREKSFPDLGITDRNGIICSGVAASFYGTTKVGQKIHFSKYEDGGDFDDELLDLTVKAFKFKYKAYSFDYIAFVPPTESGALVENFAKKLSKKIGIPIYKGIHKIRETEPQKRFNNRYSKKENVTNAFSVIDGKESIVNKNILLFDDVYDTGNTIKTIAKLLSDNGANLVAPLVIAKTIGGDL